MRQASTCWWCSNEATRLCDFTLGFNRRKHDNTIIVAEGFTCDAEMCAACCRSIGHVSGQEPDTIDVCPAHRDTGLSAGVKCFIESEAVATKARSSIRAAAARLRMRAIQGGKP